MSLQGELLAMLETVAEALGDDLCQQMVFVGGESCPKFRPTALPRAGTITG